MFILTLVSHYILVFCDPAKFFFPAGCYEINNYGASITVNTVVF